MTSYATAADLKAQINKTSAGDDAVITAIIEAASRAIDRYCNREDGAFKALATATTRQYTGNGQRHVRIDECVAVTLVETRSSLDDSYAAWGSTDWIAFTGDAEMPNFNRLPITGIFSTGSRSLPGKSQRPLIRITAKWGYAVDVPAQIEQACITQAARWYKRGEGSWSDALASADVGVLLYKQALDPDLQFMLKMGRFVRPAV